ncbi:hypothetical protein B0H16DRAFT_1026371 [Mycena metata]|uniref:Uncharacterized protein n=1 Tax=Mycena metata TaxID=1033252 RepID=A0AAD7IGU2_9AGAR|nr:hypothetical protein B0H16DRAFT_1026371 [Mycena metata]
MSGMAGWGRHRLLPSERPPTRAAVVRVHAAAAEHGGAVPAAVHCADRRICVFQQFPFAASPARAPADDARRHPRLRSVTLTRTSTSSTRTRRRACTCRRTGTNKGSIRAGDAAAAAFILSFVILGLFFGDDCYFERRWVRGEPGSGPKSVPAAHVDGAVGLRECGAGRGRTAARRTFTSKYALASSPVSSVSSGGSSANSQSHSRQNGHTGS